MLAPMIIWSYLSPWITSFMFPKEMIWVEDPHFVPPTQEEIELAMDTDEPLVTDPPMIEVEEDVTWLESFVKIFLSMFFMIIVFLL